MMREQIIKNAKQTEWIPLVPAFALGLMVCIYIYGEQAVAGDSFGITIIGVQTVILLGALFGQYLKMTD
jgi:hypothetical protein